MFSVHRPCVATSTLTSPLIRPLVENHISFWRAAQLYHRLKVSQSLGGDRCFPVGGKSTIGQSGRRVSGSLPGRCAFGTLLDRCSAGVYPRRFFRTVHLRWIRKRLFTPLPLPCGRGSEKETPPIKSGATLGQGATRQTITLLTEQWHTSNHEY